MFQTPHFTVWGAAYTAIGAAIFWGKWGKTRLKAYYLSDLLNLLSLTPKWQAAFEFLIFVALGCLVGTAIAQPSNAAQALTVGFGWTGLLTKHRT